MTCIVLFQLTLKPNAFNDLIEYTQYALPTTRAFDGCQTVSMHVKSDDDCRVFFYEVWDSAEHFAKYVQMRESKGDADRLRSLLSAPPDITLHEKLDL